MKIYSLGVKFPYVTASRLGKHLKDKGRVNADGKCYFSSYGCLQHEHFLLKLVKEKFAWIGEPLGFSIQWKIHLYIWIHISKNYNQPLIC